jgi:organic hydroperoxide reductase OsmC/OhrA
MLAQVARFAHLYSVVVLDAKMDVRGELDVADKMGLEGPGAAFQRISWTLSIESDSPAEAVQQLVEHAERACHSSQSFKQPVEVVPTVVVNGKPIIMKG